MFQVGENQITTGRFSAVAEMTIWLAIVATDRRGTAMYADLQNRKSSILPVQRLRLGVMSYQEVKTLSWIRSDAFL